ncbi:MAG: hypothetical protein C7B45_06455 [Sulfobacillus acidophilus]|uniref:Uncharacterized protein n=1 Tax=Sulfobacillus acidophilus TaxID=53633 RepID=A0A2T2WJZ3_9FIRM|nr:MAG: hypothetical protein C7B45_06455 [Sulfobacillus acidophilus]
MAGELSSTNVIREFLRIQDFFPDVRGEEESLAQCFQTLDEQIARFVTQDLIHSDDEILQALAACGLLIYDRLTNQPQRNWAQLSDGVRQLAAALQQAFDPETNGEVKAAALEYWKTPEDEQFHFTQWGSVIRRLMASVKHHQKNGPRAYCRWIILYVAKWSPDLSDDKVHWVVMSGTVPDTEKMDEILPDQ